MAPKTRSKREARFQTKGIVNGHFQSATGTAGLVAFEVLNVSASGMCVVSDRGHPSEVEQLTVVIEDISMEMAVVWVASVGNSTTRCKVGLRSLPGQAHLVKALKDRGIELSQATTAALSDTEMFLREFE